VSELRTDLVDTKTFSGYSTGKLSAKLLWPTVSLTHYQPGKAFSEAFSYYSSSMSRPMLSKAQKENRKQLARDRVCVHAKPTSALSKREHAAKPL
jgi:hypothetical protein